MARLDRIKNLTGLAEWYGRSEELRSRANLFLIGGLIDPEASDDLEERAQIQRMHEIFDQYELDSSARWMGRFTEKRLAGELYRTIADRRGAFVQPALFEAFGLTVIEAMISGLPTFATCYGGPLEIIEDDRSGFHIDPHRGEEAAARMAEFLRRADADPGEWDRISRGGIERVRERYTWALYAERLMTLARIYGFWRYATQLDRWESRRYLELLYGMVYRPRARRLESTPDVEDRVEP
jgi:sucrose synthase